jgi:hydroxylaminobenzene mutase
VLNGLFLIVLGLLWPRLALGRRATIALFWLALYGTFTNWATTLLAAFWGTGARMPIAAGAHRGTTIQELAVDVLLVSLSVAIVAACVLILWGLRRVRT